VGIIELARKTHRGCIAAKFVKYVKPPFPGVPDPFPNISRIREQGCEDVKHAIHMDFGNYTIGHLVSGRSRRALTGLMQQDFQHQEINQA
jgi:hypothetical protein